LLLLRFVLLYFDFAAIISIPFFMVGKWDGIKALLGVVQQYYSKIRGETVSLFLLQQPGKPQFGRERGSPTASQALLTNKQALTSKI
jgi:hypothetical protein